MPCKSMQVSVEAVARTEAAQSARGQSSSSIQPLALLIGAVFAAGSLIKSVNGLASTQNGVIRSVASARRELQVKQSAPAQNVAAVADVEAVKAAILTALARAPYEVESAAVTAPLKALAGASSLIKVKQAHKELLRTVEASHNRVFATALSAAVTNAIQRIGFTSIKTLPSASSKVRLVADNAAGKRLYAEVNVGVEAEPTVAAEVVGANHQESHAILDALEIALEEEGLRARGAPIRKGSGGVLPALPTHLQPAPQQQELAKKRTARTSRAARRRVPRDSQRQR
ncbi:MAG TPA: hypothetical protein VJ464_12565 [Blastocatellia bacterium]|nr:hypothetical protein [Blastocatellia bacterium]